MSLEQLPSSPVTSSELAGAWCNTDTAMSAAIEAISFVTPALELFFIRAVSDCLPLTDNPALDDSCQSFIRDEARHTSAHRRFNTALLGYLESPPRGLTRTEKLLDLATRRLSLSSRLALVAALEHATAVFSKSYLAEQAHWRFHSGFAQTLFQQHAHEEIAHRAVTFDLWQHHGGGHVVSRLLAISVIFVVGCGYLGAAVPSVVYRKNKRQLRRSLAALMPSKRAAGGIGGILKDMLRYLHPAYHPRHLVTDIPATHHPS